MFRRLQSNPIVEQYRRERTLPPAYIRILLALLVMAYVCAALMLPGVLILMPMLFPFIIAARSTMLISRATHRTEYALIRISSLPRGDIANGYIYSAYLHSRLWVWLPLLSPVFEVLRLFSDLPIYRGMWLFVAQIAAFSLSLWLQNAVALLVGFEFGRRIEPLILACVYADLIVLSSFAIAAMIFFFSVFPPYNAMSVILMLVSVIFPAVFAYSLFRQSPRWV